MSKEKKKWEIPKLICLYRGRPEEAVLLGCKLQGTVGAGKNNCAGSVVCSEQPST